MQLIEIVQIALLLFITISAIIFLFSYLGYRNKSKVDRIPNSPIIDKKVENTEPNAVNKPNRITQPETPKETIKGNPRFEVFTPDKDGQIEPDKTRAKKSHFPKTLTIRHKS